MCGYEVTKTKDMTCLRGFQGLPGYYPSFMKGCAYVADSLHRLLQGMEAENTNSEKKRGVCTKSDRNVREKWDSACEAAFVKLKRMLTEAPVLGFVDTQIHFGDRYQPQ